MLIELEILKLPMHTSIALDTSGFDDWLAEDKVNVAISLKDMKVGIRNPKNYVETNDKL